MEGTISDVGHKGPAYIRPRCITRSRINTWRTVKYLTPTGIRNPGRPVRSAVGMQTTQDDANFSVAARISCREVVGSCKQRCMTTARRGKGQVFMENRAICAGGGRAMSGRLLWNRN
jgi:hypothetical protein